MSSSIKFAVGDYIRGLESRSIYKILSCRKDYYHAVVVVPGTTNSELPNQERGSLALVDFERALPVTEQEVMIAILTGVASETE